jgi:hypothetical protein
MRRAVLTTAAVILAWSIQDIFVWQRWFEARDLYQFDTEYQYWHSAFLLVSIAAGCAWLKGWRGLMFAVATWTLANSGLADVLYYWLDFRNIPENLPWLNTLHPLVIGHPATRDSVVVSSLIWISFWLGVASQRTLRGWVRPRARIVS